MGSLIFLGIVALIIWAIVKGSSTPSTNNEAISAALSRRNQEWTDFISGYRTLVKKPTEKALVERMLQDIQAQGLGTAYILPESPQYASEQQHAAYAQPADTAVIAPLTPGLPIPEPVAYQQPAPKATPEIALDNTSLLLYFGAFLLVASVGLFISFGTAAAGLRTAAVLAVSLLLYSAGIWLFNNKPKLKQAGVAFTAVGIVVAPLVGFAAYAYIFKNSHGALVWAATSAFCLGLYLHALWVFRQPIMGYLLIFTFLSLFESGINVVGLPVYYLIWGLTVVGIFLSILSRWKGILPELVEPTEQSSQFILPVGLAVGIFVVPQQGSLQLGVCLLLAAGYYGLKALWRSDQRLSFALVTQILGIAGIGVTAFSVAHSAVAAAIVLAAVSVLELAYIATAVVDDLRRQFAAVTVISSAGAAILAFSQPLLATALLAVTGAIAGLVWLKQRQAYAFGIGLATLPILAFVFGSFAVEPGLTGAKIAYLELLAALLVALLVRLQYAWKTSIADWSVWAYAPLGTAVAIASLASAAGSLPQLLLTASVLTAVLLVFSRLEKKTVWAELVSSLLLTPFFATMDASKNFLAVVLFGQAILIVLAIVYRRETLRWSSAFLWVLLPVALGHSGLLGGRWTAAEYCWSYTVVMLGLVLSRAVARGVVMSSGNIPMASYARNASLSYVVGYLFSALMALTFSLASGNSKLHTSLLLALFIALTVLLARVIEKKRDVLDFLPLLAQGLLLSVTRPDAHGATTHAYLLLSTALGVACYLLAQTYEARHKELQGQLMIVGLATQFITPLMVCVVGSVSFAMPFGLAIAGAFTLYHVWFKGQSAKEWSGGILTVATMWTFGQLGIHEFQAYVYVLVVTLALYAYWRSQLGQTSESNSYVWAALAVATIPLLFAALGGEKGGLYGWWFLLQQVVIMLVGIAFNRSFITRWGLYTAVAAVLYQLRGLGYLALAFLAFFLIGLAVYRLQKHDDQS